MQNLWKRFALLAVVGALMGSALVAGCSGGDDDEAANNGTNNAAGAKDETE